MKSIWQSDFVRAQTQMLVRNFKRFTGRDLLAGDYSEMDLAQKLFEATFVVVSHGMEADPVLNYGNQTALSLWEMSWDEFTHTPSRLTAEVPNRGSRARLLETAARRGFIDDYSGIRISKGGRRFGISHATIWNVVSATGEKCGQAATFSEWRYL